MDQEGFAPVILCILITKCDQSNALVSSKGDNKISTTLVLKAFFLNARANSLRAWKTEILHVSALIQCGLTCEWLTCNKKEIRILCLTCLFVQLGFGTVPSGGAFYPLY